MLTIIIALILVLIAVDLFVKFIVDPQILKYEKKSKISKSSSPKLDPSFKLATETMYDGGKPHEHELSKHTADGEKLTEDELKS